MIPTNTTKVPCTVCVFQRNSETRALDKKPSYDGLLWGFSTEADGENSYVVGLVETPDGSFETPSACAIILKSPSTDQ